MMAVEIICVYNDLHSSILPSKSIGDFQVSVNCGITNSHKIHFPGLKWTDRCSFSQMGHKNDLLEPTQCIPKPLDCDKHARKISEKS